MTLASMSWLQKCLAELIHVHFKPTDQDCLLVNPNAKNCIGFPPPFIDNAETPKLTIYSCLHMSKSHASLSFAVDNGAYLYL